MADNTSSRRPPQNIDAEKSVLGAMLIDNDVIPVVLESLRSEDFYIRDHIEIFEAISDLFNEGKPIDVITVSEQLHSRGTMDRVGGLAFLTTLADFVATSANTKHYIDIVKEKSILRRLIKASGEIAQSAFEPSAEVSDVLTQAEDKIFNIVQNRSTKSFSLLKDVLNDVFTNLEELYKRKDSITGVPSGFIDLDDMLSGFQKSDLVLVAARPGMGKTSFMLNIAQYAAKVHNVPVAFFNLEMSKEQLVGRLLSSEALVDSRKLRTGRLEDDDWGRLADALSNLANAPIYIDDTTDITVTDIRSKCKKLQMEKGIGLVMIDYLQLMRGSSRTENRQQEISEISRSLKVLAKELKVPVITGSQLSRAPQQRQDHRPILSDLRESGAIEQDADIVMFLYRDDYYHEDSEEKNIAEVIVAKHRNGSTGTIKLLWNPEFTLFRNLAR